MSKHNILLVGCGGMSNAWMEYIVKYDALNLVGLVDLNLESAKTLSEKFNVADVYIGSSLEEAIEKTNPEIVFDVTVPKAHYNVTTTALAHGCHVLGEKPISDDFELARQMIQAARDAKKLYVVTQNYRYNGRIRRVQKALTDGLIGKVHTLNIDFCVGGHFDGFRAEMEHVLLVDMAIHSFDMSRFLSGTNPRSVFCHEFNPPGSWFNHGASAHAIFEMTDDVTVNYRGSWCAEGFGTGWNCQWRIIGSEGTLLWDGEDDIRIERPIESDKFLRDCETVEAPTTDWDEAHNGHGGIMRDFIAALENGTKPMTHCEDNINSVAMVFKAVESAETGQRIAIDLAG